MRAHVADGADSPVDPSAPVERVINGVVLDEGCHAQKQIPGEALGLRIVAGHRVRQPRVDARDIPVQRV